MPHCRGCPPFQKGEGLAYKGQPQGSQRRWPWERTATWDRSSSRRAPRVLPQAPNLVKSHITLDTLSETQNRGRGLGGPRGTTVLFPLTNVQRHALLRVCLQFVVVDRHLPLEKRRVERESPGSPAPPLGKPVCPKICGHNGILSPGRGPKFYHTGPRAVTRPCLVTCLFPGPSLAHYAPSPEEPAGTRADTVPAVTELRALCSSEIRCPVFPHPTPHSKPSCATPGSVAPLLTHPRAYSVPGAGMPGRWGTAHSP